MAAKQHSPVSFDGTGGDIIFDDEDITAAVTPGVAASVTKFSTGISSDGNGGAHVDIVTLADGVSGQIKCFVYKAQGNSGDTVEITPAHFVSSYTKITFDTPGQGCMMVFHGGKWCVIGNNGGVMS